MVLQIVVHQKAPFQVDCSFSDPGHSRLICATLFVIELQNKQGKLAVTFIFLGSRGVLL